MRNRKRRSKILALTLAVSVGTAGISVPDYDVKAAEDMEQILQQDSYADEHGETDGVVEVTELPAEDGEYVVYMDCDITGKISFADEAYEIPNDSPAVVLETDLSAAQLDQLEELSGQEEEVYA